MKVLWRDQKRNQKNKTQNTQHTLINFELTWNTSHKSNSRFSSPMYQLRCVVGEAIFRPLIIPLSSNNKSFSGNKEFVLGRGKAADILIKCFDEELHSRLSRRHLKISVRDSKHVYIEDLGGTNGSKINGKSLKPNTPVRINMHDMIQLGGNKKGLDVGHWPVWVLEKKITVLSCVEQVFSSPVSSPASAQQTAGQHQEVCSRSPISSPVNVKSKKRKRTEESEISSSNLNSSLPSLPLSKPPRKKLQVDTSTTTQIRVDDCLGCACCEELIIDPIVLRCAHSLCFVCAHTLSKSSVSECPTCHVSIPSVGTSELHRSVKLDMLVTRYVEMTEDSDGKYAVRVQEHADYCRKNVDVKEMEVEQKEMEEDSESEAAANWSRIIVCDQCGREGHEEEQCPYVDSEEEVDRSEEDDDDDDDGW